MSELSNARPEFYRHSGRVDMARLVPAALGMVAAVLLLAGVYAVLFNYVRFLVILSAFFWILACIGVGAIAQKGIQWAKVRNIPMGGGLALMLGLLMLGASWLFWLDLLLAQPGVPPISAWDLLTHPARAWRIILKINETGVWTIGRTHDTVSGVALWAVWLVEAGGLVGTPVSMALRYLRNTPFCENCGKWGTARVLANVNRGDITQMRDRLEQKDFAYLQGLGPTTSDLAWVRVKLEGCADCDSVPLLTAELVTINVSKKGERKEVVKPIVRHLMLSTEESTALIMACANLDPPVGT